MISAFRKILLLAIASLGFAAGARGDSGAQVFLYTPGYFVDQALWTKATSGAYLYYKDFETESYQPFINPYSSKFGAGNAIVDWTGYNQKTFTVTNNQSTSAGRYVKSWNGYEWDATSMVPSSTSPIFSKSGYPKSFTVSYSMVAGYAAVCIVPQMNMITYTLDYNANGGSWTTEPEEKTLIWSNEVTFAKSDIVGREGHTFVGWNTSIDGKGSNVEPGLTCCGGSYLGIDAVDADGHTNITIYAQWSVNQYPLQLKLGNGIAKLNYEVTIEGTKTSGSVTSDTNLDIDYGTEYKVWAEAKAGYSSPKPTEEDPKKGAMGTGGAIVSSSATPNTISVTFDGNGETSGSTMDSQTFTVDVANYLKKNSFVRGYSVSFDSKGGSSCDAKTASYKLQDPCWNNAKDGSGEYSYADLQSVTNPCNSTGEAVKLYAQWNTNNVTAITLPTTTWSGHTHSGWYADYGLNEYIGAAGATYMPTNDITLYAGWDKESYTVNFYSDEPSSGGTNISSQTIPFEGRAVEPEHPTKAYRKFSSWNNSGWTKVVDNLEVWPLWSPKNYRLRYWPNYGRGQETGDEDGYSCNVTGDPHDSVPIRSSVFWDYDNPGYAFSGWDTNALAKTAKWHPSTDPDVDGLSFKGLDKIGGGKEIVDFYAIWSPNAYKVRFNGGSGATGTMSDQSFEYGVAKPLTANAFTRADEQTFFHWTNSVGKVFADCEAVSNLTTTADATVDLYAVWSNYHYVRFDKNGATNECGMAVQKFSGAETNALAANVYGKVGYTFSGWATNAVAATNLCVTYTNCQEVAFPTAKANETNDLYAVWTTNRYSIAFDPGTSLESPYFFGKMDSLTNCAYDTAITVKCGYTNYCSRGLLGWSRTKGATVAEYPVTSASSVTLGGDTIVSNLTADADGLCTLYAVWSDVGNLSKSAGLFNAALVQESNNVRVRWYSAIDYPDGDEHDECIALRRCNDPKDTAESGEWKLSVKVVGGGQLHYRSYWEKYGSAATSFKLYLDGDEVKVLPDDPSWSATNVVAIAGGGVHEIWWVVKGDINNGENYDRICLDDISWTPGIEVKPGSVSPGYASEAEAKSAAGAARVVRPNAAVEGVVSADDYNAMFEVKVEQTGFAPATEQWSLVPELKPAVSNEVQQALDVGSSNLVQVVNTNLAGVIAFTLAMKAGLYYGIAATNEVEGIFFANPTNWVLGVGSEKQAISVDRPSAVNGFFELRATAIPPHLSK